MMTRRKLIEGTATVAGAALLIGKSPGQTRKTPRAPAADAQGWDVRRFGARGDGLALDTAAVQSAIDACHKAGGGSVLFRAGSTFLIGTIYLRSDVRLHIEPNATILGSNNLADYGNDVGLNPFYPETIDPCLIFAKDATGIGISGGGKIVGHTGTIFVPPPNADARAAKERPMLMRFDTCSHISVTDVSFSRCGSWCMHLKNSREIFLGNVFIHNENQDGFDLDSCQNVSISDCHLDCGDDAIAITTSIKDHPARNITITNCLLKSTCAGIRFGPLSKGDFENIAVSNCIFYDCNLGGIKLGVFEGATIRNCVFDNLVMDRVTAPISIFIATWPDIGSTDPNSPMMPPGRIHDLQFRGIRAVTQLAPPSTHPDANSTLFFHGHPQSAIENILLRDVNITFAGGGTVEERDRRDIVDMDGIDYRRDGYWTDHKSTWGVPPAYGLYARHLKGLQLQNVTFQLANSDQRSAIFCSDSEEVEIYGFKAACDPRGTAMITAVNCTGMQLEAIDATPQASVLLRLEGLASDKILIRSTRPGKFLKEVEYASGASKAAILPPDGSAGPR